MAQPLGNPEEQANVSVTASGVTVTITQGLSFVEFQNTGLNDVAFGKASTLTFARGGLIYSGGDRKTFENVPSGWQITFKTDTSKTSTLRQINYV